MDQNIKLSIVILNYKTKHLLRLALKNLYALQIPFPFEIIVVDNASGDGSVAMVTKLFPQTRLIINNHNTGHAHGNNVGIRAATGQYVLIMNTDIIFLNTADITAMLDYFDQHPEVGLIGPRLCNGDGTIQYSCFRPYSTMTPIYRRTPLGQLAQGRRDLDRHLMMDFDHNQLREVDWILGACIILPRAVLNHVGLFNEQFFLYFADFELCDRLRYHGYKVVYYPDVTIVHYHRRESAQGSVWGGLGSLLNYVTRVHLKDWTTYKKIIQQGYDTRSNS
ncbi:MAG: glycosyltransferase family 2 protein [Candidatus Kerfeldbacteria bacterium]|nr:glycosyltransferase family 2 protein [Candidatus Kerfeldbacteria bacterium]